MELNTHGLCYKIGSVNFLTLKKKHVENEKGNLVMKIFTIGAPAPKLSGKAKRQLSSMAPSQQAAHLAAVSSKAKVKRPAFVV